MKSTVVFDLGGVLIDWNPRHLYRKVFEDENAMEQFLANVCDDDWQEQQNESRSWSEAIAERVAKYPRHRPFIEMYRSRWPEMLGDAHRETVSILDELRNKDIKLYGLTNWSAEMFPHARERYAFLEWFEGIVVSGEIGIRKPSPEIYLHLLEKYKIEASEAIFVDDSYANVEAARTLGMESYHFTSADTLRAYLQSVDVL